MGWAHVRYAFLDETTVPISDFDIRGAESRSFKAKAVEERVICVDFLIENLKWHNV